MTTTPTPDPSITAPPVVDSQTGPAVPPADPPADPPKAAKKAPAKKAAAKKAAAPTPPPAEGRKDSRSLYLPALPEGFEYTDISVTGPGGESIKIAPAGGADAAVGSATLSVEGAGLERESTFADMKSAIAAGAKAAKSMAKIVEQEAALAKAREEAFSL